MSRHIHQFAMFILKKHNGHPFSHDDEIDPTVIIEIGPQRVADQANIPETRSHFIRHVGEFRMARFRIVAIDKTADRQRIVSR